ncbi:hypothetical protein V8C86DRAFT_2585860 [Haematococcus lacustris]
MTSSAATAVTPSSGPWVTLGLGPFGLPAAVFAQPAPRVGMSLPPAAPSLPAQSTQLHLGAAAGPASGHSLRLQQLDLGLRLDPRLPSLLPLPLSPLRLDMRQHRCQASAVGEVFAEVRVQLATQAKPTSQLKVLNGVSAHEGNARDMPCDSERPATGRVVRCSDARVIGPWYPEWLVALWQTLVVLTLVMAVVLPVARVVVLRGSVATFIPLLPSPSQPELNLTLDPSRGASLPPVGLPAPEPPQPSPLPSPSPPAPPPLNIGMHVRRLSYEDQLEDAPATPLEPALGERRIMDYAAEAHDNDPPPRTAPLHGGHRLIRQRHTAGDNQVLEPCRHHH